MPRPLTLDERVFDAEEVFELLITAERRLASTRWDTRASEPVRAVPGAARAAVR